MKKRFSLILLLVVFLILGACSNSNNSNSSSNTGGSGSSDNTSSASSDKSSSGPKTLLVAADQDPVGLDPQKVPAASSVRIYSLIYDSLTKMDSNFTLQPDLAKSWDITDGGKTITFHLQQGVKFHNGREMTSNDVKYSYERILDPKTGSIAASYFSSIDSIETPDKYTVVFKLKTPDATLLTNTSSAYASIVPKEVKDLNKEAVGTGPFMLEANKEGQYVLLKKNPDYFIKDEPKVDEIKFLIMKDPAQRTAAIRAGKVDIAAISADTAKILSKDKNVTVKSYQSLQYSYLGINVNKKPLDNPKVREAISYAVDRNQIIQTVWKGKAELTGPIAPAEGNWAIDVKSLPSYQTNIDKAKQLLADAGYPNGFNITIDTASTYPDMIDTAQVIQQQLKAIGINAKVNQLEWGTYVNTWKSKKMDMMVGRNTSGMDPDRSLRFFFSTKGSANVWNYSNSQFDSLVQQAQAATDQSKRKDLYDQAQSILIQDNPNLFLASPSNFYAVGQRVEGFVPTSAGESTALVQTSIK